MTPRIRCLIGPTAAGKTALTLALAKVLPIEVISVDSAMIYRGMDIGTAKPTLAELQGCPHHLLDIRNPDESYSAAQFVSDATTLIETILQRGKMPVLVGGTMLYFRALQQGLSVLPPANASVRAEIETLAQEKGWPGVHQALQQVDAVSAARIQPQDAQRLSRALEVYRLTGQPLSTLHAIQLKNRPYSFCNALLFPSNRVWLHDRIALRFKQMMAAGFIEEVEQLLSTWPESRHAPAMRSVGYRQVIQYLDGHLSRDELMEKGVIATRQLAKRQCTWMRSWGEGTVWDPEDSMVFNKLKKFYTW